MNHMTESTLPVLVADDHPDIRLAMRILLRSEGIPSVEVDSPAAAMEAASRTAFACAVIDLNYAADTTSGNEGLELVTRLREEAPELPVVAMTAWGSIDVAVRAMRLGAADFIEKPWNNERLVHTIRCQMALRECVKRIAACAPKPSCHARVTICSACTNPPLCGVS